MPERNTVVKLNGQKWVARRQVRYQLQPSQPLTVMVGQQTHADSQGVLEHPLDVRGPMGLYERRLGRGQAGVWDSDGGIMVNDGEVTLGPALSAMTPMGLDTGTDVGCSYCLSDIDGQMKVYVAYGSDVFKSADGVNWTLVATVAGAKGLSIIESRATGGQRALLWACGDGADMQVSYDGVSFSAEWPGEKADFVFNAMTQGLHRNPWPLRWPVKAYKGKLFGFTFTGPGQLSATASPWTAGPLSLENHVGANGLRYLGSLSNVTLAPGAAPRSGPGQLLPGQGFQARFDQYTFLGSRGVIAVVIRTFQHSGLITDPATGDLYRGGIAPDLVAMPFPETEALGEIIAGCIYQGQVALSNGAFPIYLWTPGKPPEPIGPFGIDGVPSRWQGAEVRALEADGRYLLALVSAGGNVYAWRYDAATDTWDLPPPPRTGSIVGGQRPMMIVRAGMGGSGAVGSEVELVPNANGTYNTWVKAGPAPAGNFDAVDDPVPDEDETYVESRTGGGKQSFGLSDITLPTGYSIVGLRIEALVKSRGVTTTGNRVSLFVRSGLSVASSPTFTGIGRPQTAWGGLSTRGGGYEWGIMGYSRVSHTFYTDPATGAPWTQAGVNGAEAGLDSGTDTGVRCTWLRAYVIVSGSAGSPTDKSMLLYHAGDPTTPALVRIDLPETGWNLRGSGLNYCAGDANRKLYLPHIGFNRPERQKVVYALRFHGELSVTNAVRASYSVDKGSEQVIGTDATADGAMLRLGSTGEGIKVRTFQPILALLGGNGTSSPVLAPLGIVVLYDEVPDERMLIGLDLDLRETWKLRAPRVEIEDLVQELEALATQGTLFAFEFADRPTKLVKVSPMTVAQLLESLNEVSGDVVRLWLAEPVPSP